MKKVLFIICTIMIILCLYPKNLFATDSLSTDNSGMDSPSTVIQDHKQEINDLERQISEMSEEYDLLKDMDLYNFITNYITQGSSEAEENSILNNIKNYIFKHFLGTLKIMSFILIVALLSAFTDNVQRAFSDNEVGRVAYFCCYLVVVILISKIFIENVNLAVKSIRDVSDFTISAIPMIITLIASSGSITEAAIMDPIIISSITFISDVYITFLIPLILIYAVTLFIDKLSLDFKIDKLKSFIKQFALTFQGGIIAAFVGLLSVRSMATKTLDQVFQRTAKFAVENFIPVVGKAFSDAISTVVGYSVLLKNAISIVGMIVVIIVIVVPIIKILIVGFMLKFTASIIQPVCNNNLNDLIYSAGDCLTLISSCLITVSIMVFIILSILASAGKVLIT